MRALENAWHSRVGVALSGEKAAVWLSTIGWKVLEGERGIQVYADYFSGREVVVARLWLNAGSIRPLSNPGDPDLLHVFLPVVGELEVSHARGEFEISTNQLFVHQHQDLRVVRNRKPMAGILLAFREASLPIITYGHIPRLKPLIPASSERALLVDTVTATLNEIKNVASDSYPKIAQAVRLLLAATLESCRPNLIGTARSETLERALRVIESRSADQEFTIDELSVALGVSLPTLHRVFKPIGVTAGEQLRRVRLEHARILLGSLTRTPERLAWAARQSGFLSARSLGDALRRSQQ